MICGECKKKIIGIVIRMTRIIKKKKVDMTVCGECFNKTKVD